jgi:hypothetical protein
MIALLRRFESEILSDISLSLSSLSPSSDERLGKPRIDLGNTSSLRSARIAGDDVGEFDGDAGGGGAQLVFPGDDNAIFFREVTYTRCFSMGVVPPLP